MGRPKKSGGAEKPLHDLSALINKEMKKNIASDEIEAEPIGWISTGNDMLDMAISKDKGGIPIGRITEFNGMESTGKSLICLHLIKNAQKQGGMVILCDTEGAYTEDFTSLMGVDIENNFVYVSAGTSLDEVYSMMQKVSLLMRTELKDIPFCLFILDSISFTPTDSELKSDISSEKGGYQTSKSVLNARSFSQIKDWCIDGRIAFVYTAQHRAKFNAVPFGEQSQASVGGYAPIFASSVRVMLKLMKVIKTTTDPKREVGVQVKFTVKKTRFNHPHRQIISEIYYDSGFDNYNSWLYVAEDYKVVKKAGSWYKFDYPDAEDGQLTFQKKDWIGMLENDEKLRKFILDKIREEYINTKDRKVVDLDEKEFNEEEDEI